MTAGLRRPGPVVEATEQAAVPWMTVLPLAVVMDYADGFWTTALRGAVGSIDRTEAPFTAWLRWSTMLLPVFVFAVLAALLLARRRLRPDTRRRDIIGVTLLVTLAGTLAGAVVLAISSGYDYVLQAAQVQTMASMGRSCAGSCLVSQRQATFGLQLRAVTVGTEILLATNLVVVGWVVALRGGRITLRGRPIRAGQQGRDLRPLLAVALVGSAVVHLAVVPEHLTEWPASAGFFVVLAAAELMVAVVVSRRPPRTPALAVAVVVSVLPLVVWAWSRSVGLPFSPDTAPEAIGEADVMACLLEVVALVAAVAVAVARGDAPRRRLSGNALRLAVVALVAVTVVGLAGSGIDWLDWLDGFDVSEHGTGLVMTTDAETG
ncbi:hypothetical protein [Lapillicoccus sp.]|uniref:hypothetical protein n=1 Tax=Lapillicoccus sp. TaxID=1909287 RepID=UPI0025D549F6|nr:hypothetical protein [Lapillicoccus sp.]